MYQKFAILSLLSILSSATFAANGSCKLDLNSAATSSYQEVLLAMKMEPYDLKDLPVRPITLFRAIANKLLPNFFVGTRSAEILQDKRDFRTVGLPKPIHPMGVGFEGTLEMTTSRWSGAFRGGSFPVLARASISQGNPLKVSQPSTIGKILGSTPKAQPRSTAFALKIFESSDPHLQQKTANIVFQNDLNGQINSDGTAIHWNQAAQTNHPALSLAKIRHFYEVLTLIGVAVGSFNTPQDRTTRFPFINPAIRPVHSLAEMGEKSVSEVRTPTWVMLRPSKQMEIVARDDFRLELYATAEKNSELVYELHATDSFDSSGQKNWERVGTLRLKNAILSKGVDEIVLFPHDTMVSSFTGAQLFIPTEPSK